MPLYRYLVILCVLYSLFLIISSMVGGGKGRREGETVGQTDFDLLGEWVGRVRGPHASTPPPADRRKDVAFISYELEGVRPGGGIGTAFVALARLLAAQRAGWGASKEDEVVVRLNRDDPLDPSDWTHSGDDWIATFQEEWDLSLSLAKTVSPALTARSVVTGSAGPLPSSARVPSSTFDESYACGFPCSRAFAAFVWLWDRQPAFPVIHVHDNAGFGAFVARERGRGRAFRSSAVVLGMHGPHRWEREANRAFLSEHHSLECDFMERTSARYADVVISPSTFIFRWAVERGWSFPRHSFVWQNVMPELPIDATPTPPGTLVTNITTIAFFGRLETRKGLAIFLDAAGRLAPLLADRAVSLVFLGSAATVNGVESSTFIRRSCDSAGLTCTVVTDARRVEALTYLAAPTVLPVIASLTENSPYTVLELLGMHKAFLATAVGGIPELLHPDDVPSVLFEPSPGALATRLRAALTGGVRVPRASASADDIAAGWLGLHAELTGATGASLAASLPPSLALPLPHPEGWDADAHLPLPPDSPTPVGSTTTVCVAYCGGSEHRAALEATLASVAAAAPVTPASVIVTLPADVHFDLSVPGEAEGNVIVRRIAGANVGLGTLRSACVEAATSASHIVFLDAGDRFLYRRSLALLLATAEATSADVVSAALHFGDSPPTPSTSRRGGVGAHLRVPLGCTGVALFYGNCAGSRNALWRRDALLAVGAFRTDEFGAEFDVWPLYARFDAAGYHNEALPYPLFGRLVLLPGRTVGTCPADPSPGSLGGDLDEYVLTSRVAAPYEAALATHLPALRFIPTFGLHLQRHVESIVTKTKRWYRDRAASLKEHYESQGVQ
jgi:glycosyltransferase involved in cell wall biosynthesis